MRTKPFFALLVVVAAVLVASTYAYASVTKPALSSASVPIYVPAAPADRFVQCGTTQTIASVDYWPLPTESVYTAQLYARGGGTLILAAPGVTDSVRVPADDEQREYTLTIQRIPNGPSNISLTAVGSPCGTRTTVRGMELHATNIRVAAP